MICPACGTILHVDVCAHCGEAISPGDAYERPAGTLYCDQFCWSDAMADARAEDDAAHAVDHGYHDHDPF